MTGNELLDQTIVIFLTGGSIVAIMVLIMIGLFFVAQTQVEY